MENLEQKAIRARRQASRITSISLGVHTAYADVLRYYQENPIVDDPKGDKILELHDLLEKAKNLTETLLDSANEEMYDATKAYKLSL